MTTLEAVAELMASATRTVAEAVEIQRKTALRIVELMAENAALRAEVKRLRSERGEIRQ